jgi:DNA-binding transcriptional LysR family regulator
MATPISETGYLVGADGDKLTSRPTVQFSKLHNLPLVLFCRPSTWRNRLEQLATEHGISLNVALEADSLSMQTHIAADGCVYALLGPYAIAAASRTCRLQSSKGSILRCLVTSRWHVTHGELTLVPDRDADQDREFRRSGIARDISDLPPVGSGVTI